MWVSLTDTMTPNHSLHTDKFETAEKELEDTKMQDISRQFFTSP